MRARTLSLRKYAAACLFTALCAAFPALLRHRQLRRSSLAVSPGRARSANRRLHPRRMGFPLPFDERLQVRRRPEARHQHRSSICPRTCLSRPKLPRSKNPARSRSIACRDASSTSVMSRPGEIAHPGLLYLPNKYVVPGGRFNEMYGWDSYFIILGLIGTAASIWPKAWSKTSSTKSKITAESSTPTAPTTSPVHSRLSFPR